MPLVSVLVPVFNREDLLGPCVRSALSQSCRDLEVVISDNASTDGTWEVCRRLAVEDPRVRIHRNDSNLGPVLNWQACARLATGFYAKFLFSDDLLFPTCIERLLAPFSTSVAFSFSPVAIGPDPGSVRLAYRWLRGSRTVPSALFLDDVLTGADLPASPGAALFRLADLRRFILDDIPSPSIRDFAAHGAGIDLAIFLLAARAWPSVAFVAEPLSFFRDHARSITIASDRAWLRRRYSQAKVWFASAHAAPDLARRVLADAWLLECWLSRRWVAPGAVVSALSARPGPAPGLDDLAAALLRRLLHRLAVFLR